NVSTLLQMFRAALRILYVWLSITSRPGFLEQEDQRAESRAPVRAIWMAWSLAVWMIVATTVVSCLAPATIAFSPVAGRRHRHPQMWKVCTRAIPISLPTLTRAPRVGEYLLVKLRIFA